MHPHKQQKTVADKLHGGRTKHKHQLAAENQIDKRDIFMTDTFVDHHLCKQRKHQLHETADKQGQGDRCKCFFIRSYVPP